MYRQPVENVVGRVHSADYRIHGTLFPRPNVGMPDQLNRADQPYLPIGSPHLFPNGVGPADESRRMVQGDFIAVPRESILWVVGGDPNKPDLRDFVLREVAVLYGRVLLRGKLRVGSAMRTSDYVRARIDSKPFDALLEVGVSELRGGVSFEDLEVAERCAFATVNLRATTGIVEMGSMLGPAGPEARA